MLLQGTIQDFNFEENYALYYTILIKKYYCLNNDKSILNFFLI